ncbi:hypothetical protein AB7294_04215 [Cylindrospermopsis raciborskii UAM/DH-MRr]|jgi:hypothetical protein|uniref:hypothetical protein n=1 Tax=Cylindrospermopsis raciborskii TaxID=77022 RepID=UPI00387A58DD
MPYTQIGVGYTYFLTFQKYSFGCAGLNFDLLFSDIIPSYGRGKLFGFSGEYIGIVPVLWGTKFLFCNAPPIAFYYSLSVWSLICASIAASVGLMIGSLRKNTLLIIVLCMSVSPTFLEMNSSVHRYHLLVLGLFLFFVGYLGVTRPSTHRFISITTIILGLLCIGTSKPPLFLSVFFFVFLDLWSKNKIPILSELITRMSPLLRLSVIAGLIIFAQLFISTYVVPESYLTKTQFTGGGRFSLLIKIPLVGLLFRLFIAIQSPTQWLNFTQWDLYGYNYVFLITHVFSTCFSYWLILSLWLRWKYIRIYDDIRTCSIFGIALASSLAFSAIGFHVYWAPAVPFLATLLKERGNLISLSYPIYLSVVIDIFIVATSFVSTN